MINSVRVDTLVICRETKPKVPTSGIIVTFEL